MSRLALHHIDAALAQAQSILSTESVPALLTQSRRCKEVLKKLQFERQGDGPLSVPNITAGQHETFRYLWALHHPIAVDDVQLKGDWTPAAFVKSHGAVKVSMIDSSRLKPVKTTVENFFAVFVSVEDRVVKLKVTSFSHSSLVIMLIHLDRIGRLLPTFVRSS